MPMPAASEWSRKPRCCRRPAASSGQLTRRPSRHCSIVSSRPQARDGERYVAHVLPLTSGTRRKAGTSYSAVATVFVHKAVLDLPSPPEAVANEFQLTPAELRVLFAIIEVGGVPEVAEVLGISEGTVKTHLHHVFGKTSTTRQVELVKLVAGYSNTLIA